jgi:putative ABC transport system ATP-binding protein
VLQNSWNLQEVDLDKKLQEIKNQKSPPKIKRRKPKINNYFFSMKPILQTENLSKIYKIGRVDTQALRGVSIRVNAGEFVAIMGQSGCGKSTLLHLLGGLLSPTSGTIIIDGEDLSKVSTRSVPTSRRKIGFVFQRFNLFPTLTADGNLKVSRKNSYG